MQRPHEPEPPEPPAADDDGDSGEVIRLGVAPRGGKSERRGIAPTFVDPDQTPAPRSSGDDSWGSEKHRPSHRWLVITGACFLALIACAVIYVAISNTGRDIVIPRKSSPPPAAGLSMSDPLVVLLENEDVAIAQSRTYATTNDPEAVARMSLDPGLVRTLLATHPHRPLAPPTWQPREPIYVASNQNNHAFSTVASVLADGSPFISYHQLVGDSLALDWRATTGYGTAGFDQLSQGSGDASEIRGYLRKGLLHTPSLPDSTHACFTFTSPDRQSTIWCYTVIGTRVHKDVVAAVLSTDLVPAASANGKVTLTLRPAPSARPNQWMIEKLLCPEWSLPR